jgi:hypothetical protein
MLLVNFKVEVILVKRSMLNVINFQTSMALTPQMYLNLKVFFRKWINFSPIFLATLQNIIFQNCSVILNIIYVISLLETYIGCKNTYFSFYCLILCLLILCAWDFDLWLYIFFPSTFATKLTNYKLIDLLSFEVFS